jgi:uncharacterized protein
MNSQPLSENEFDTLSAALTVVGARAMNLEQVDGFLAALVCSPEAVTQTEWLREALGFDVMNDEDEASQPSTQTLIELLSRHHDDIAHTLRSGGVLTPLLIADESGEYPANDWANGFLRGMGLRRGAWAELLDDEDHCGSLVPIFALAHEHDPDPKMRPYKEPITAEVRERLIVGAAAGVMNIYRYFRERPAEEAFSLRDASPFQRFAPKVGRNEPCPCGSGKKYKMCCGRVTFH